MRILSDSQGILGFFSPAKGGQALFCVATKFGIPRKASQILVEFGCAAHRYRSGRIFPAKREKSGIKYCIRKFGLNHPTFPLDNIPTIVYTLYRKGRSNEATTYGV